MSKSNAVIIATAIRCSDSASSSSVMACMASQNRRWSNTDAGMPVKPVGGLGTQIRKFAGCRAQVRPSTQAIARKLPLGVRASHKISDPCQIPPKKPCQIAITVTQRVARKVFGTGVYWMG